MSDLRPFDSSQPDAPHRGFRPGGLVAARARVKARPGSRDLNPDEFLRLLLSRRALVRVVEPGARLHGLFDRASGETYWIEAERLATTGC